MPREIREHWDRVAGLGCLITRQPAQICHCHGASISDELPPEYHPGMAERQNHWLVIPLARRLHEELDADPRAFEERYEKQTQLLHEVSERLGYDVYEKAGVTRR